MSRATRFDSVDSDINSSEFSNLASLSSPNLSSLGSSRLSPLSSKAETHLDISSANASSKDLVSQRKSSNHRSTDTKNSAELHELSLPSLGFVYSFKIEYGGHEALSSVYSTKNQTPKDRSRTNRGERNVKPNQTVPSAHILLINIEQSQLSFPPSLLKGFGKQVMAEIQKLSKMKSAALPSTSSLNNKPQKPEYYPANNASNKKSKTDSSLFSVVAGAPLTVTLRILPVAIAFTCSPLDESVSVSLSLPQPVDVVCSTGPPALKGFDLKCLTLTVPEIAISLGQGKLGSFVEGRLKKFFVQFSRASSGGREPLNSHCIHIATVDVNVNASHFGQAFTVEKAWLSESMSISPEDDEVPKYQHVDSFLPRVEARERKEEKSPEGLKQQSFPLTYMLFSLGKAEFKLDMNEVENLAATCMLKVEKIHTRLADSGRKHSDGSRTYKVAIETKKVTLKAETADLSGEGLGGDGFVCNGLELYFQHTPIKAFFAQPHYRTVHYERSPRERVSSGYHCWKNRRIHKVFDRKCSPHINRLLLKMQPVSISFRHGYLSLLEVASKGALTISIQDEYKNTVTGFVGDLLTGSDLEALNDSGHSGLSGSGLESSESADEESSDSDESPRHTRSRRKPRRSNEHTSASERISTSDSDDGERSAGSTSRPSSVYETGSETGSSHYTDAEGDSEDCGGEGSDRTSLGTTAKRSRGFSRRRRETSESSDSGKEDWSDTSQTSNRSDRGTFRAEGQTRTKRADDQLPCMDEWKWDVNAIAQLPNKLVVDVMSSQAVPIFIQIYTSFELYVQSQFAQHRSAPANGSVSSESLFVTPSMLPPLQRSSLSSSKNPFSQLHSKFQRRQQEISQGIDLDLRKWIASLVWGSVTVAGPHLELKVYSTESDSQSREALLVTIVNYRVSLGVTGSGIQQGDPTNVDVERTLTIDIGHHEQVEGKTGDLVWAIAKREEASYQKESNKGIAIFKANYLDVQPFSAIFQIPTFVLEMRTKETLSSVIESDFAIQWDGNITVAADLSYRFLKLLIESYNKSYLDAMAVMNTELARHNKRSSSVDAQSSRNLRNPSADLGPPQFSSMLTGTTSVSSKFGSDAGSDAGDDASAKKSINPNGRFQLGKPQLNVLNNVKMGMSVEKLLDLLNLVSEEKPLKTVIPQAVHSAVTVNIESVLRKFHRLSKDVDEVLDA